MTLRRVMKVVGEAAAFTVFGVLVIAAALHTNYHHVGRILVDAGEWCAAHPTPFSDFFSLW